ncbi:MAG: response regulator [Chloroflexi bacterium]|nr:response regulator [Chloroflexota bacterium]
MEQYQSHAAPTSEAAPSTLDRFRLDGIGSELSPPVLVPSGMPSDITQVWIFFLRSVGEVLREHAREPEARARVAQAFKALVPHDDMRFGRFEAGGMVWLRPADDYDAQPPGPPVPVDDPLIQQVLSEGRPLLLPRRVLAPLRLGWQPTGVVEFSHRPPWTYTPDHLAAAGLIGEQLGPMIELMFHLKQEEQARKRLDALIEISRAISVSLDLDEILPVMARSLIQALDLSSCIIALTNDDDTMLVPRIVIGDDLWPPHLDRTSKNPPHPPVHLDDPECAPLLTLRRPTALTVPGKIGDTRRKVGLTVPERILVVPLVIRDRLRGAAVLPIRDDARQFGEETLAMAMGIAQSAAVAVEHAQLYGRAREVAVVEERNRLAREVHDTLAQGITAIALQLETAERLLPPGAEAKRIVADAREQAHRSLDEARRAVWGLTAKPLDGASLPEALQGEVERFERRTGVAARLTHDAEVEPLTDEQATALLRVAQEALHNVEKHAQATRVRVELVLDRGSGLLTLLVADDGQGFDRRTLPGPDGGFGLSGMRERMRLVGGELEVESAVGWGTRVQARLHVESEPPAVEPALEHEAGPIRVLLVDDHPLAREGLRRLLEGRDDMVVVGEAGDGLQGVERALALRPDVVLMDLQMPRLSGVGAVQALREQWHDARVLIVTTFAQDEHLFEALRAGARGYLLKDAGPDALASAIKTIHEGGSLVQPTMAAKLIDRFGELATRDRLAEPLTEREIEILHLAAGGARNKEIADRLIISEKTVKNALSRLYGKLGANGRAEAIARGRALGLLPLDEAHFEPEHSGAEASARP